MNNSNSTSRIKLAYALIALCVINLILIILFNLNQISDRRSFEKLENRYFYFTKVLNRCKIYQDNDYQLYYSLLYCSLIDINSSNNHELASSSIFD